VQYIVNYAGHYVGGMKAIYGLKDLHCTKSGQIGDVGVDRAAGRWTLQMLTLKDILKNR
jgi:hypothetical protein